MTGNSIPQSTHPSPFIEFENITLARGDAYILPSLSLTIHDGESVAILGPNGSGKSTLIKAMTCELYPVMTEEAFRFTFWGRDTWNVFDLRSRYGIVTSDLQISCNREMKGFEVLLSGFFSSIGLFNHVITDTMIQRVYEVAGLLDINHLLDRMMTEISSGEARRLLIGRALVHAPRVLILDEPTNNFDLQALHTLREYLRKIVHTGISIILVTHQIHDIIPEIPRVILMQNGRIVKDGKKEEILTDTNMSKLYSVEVQIQKVGNFYYATGY